MAEEQKENQVQQQPIDMPEGKMEISLRVLSNELIGIKMSVDDMKMKWVVIGVGALHLCYGQLHHSVHRLHRHLKV